jgi:competence protein ComEC
LGQIQLLFLNELPINESKTSYSGGKNLVIQLNEIELNDALHTKAIGTIFRYKKNRWFSTGTKILIYVEGKKAIAFNQNDFILVASRFTNITNKNNPGEFNAVNFWKSKGVFKTCFLTDVDICLLQKNNENWIDKQLINIRNHLGNLLEKELNGKNLAIAKALILGDKSYLDQETRNSFGATGAMHVLAVSGMHIGIISQLLLFIFQFFSQFIQRKSAVFSIVLLLWIYALLTGFSPSVVRAVFMFSVLMLAQEMGENFSAINTLFFTAFILALINPMVLYDIGFQLSYLAMLGIFTLYKPIAAWYSTKNKLINYFWQGSAVGFAAQAMTVPLTLYYFHQFPNYFALTNLGIMAISTIAMGFGMGVFILHYIPILGKIASVILAFSLWSMLAFLQWVEELPGSVEYGFSIPLYLVPILMVLTFMLIVNKCVTIKWKMAAFLFIGTLIFISFKRYEQHNVSHLCFFNTNQLVFTVKIKSQIVVIYDWKNEKKDQQVKGIISNYAKLYPGKLTFIPLIRENINVKFGRHLIEVKKTTDGRYVLVDNKVYLVKYKNDESIYTDKRSKETVIYMPWLANRQSLTKGAMLFKI